MEFFKQSLLPIFMILIIIGSCYGLYCAIKHDQDIRNSAHNRAEMIRKISEQECGHFKVLSAFEKDKDEALVICATDEENYARYTTIRIDE